MNNLVSLGLITGLTILFAFLADLVIAPALMDLLYSKKQKKSNTEILITQ
jgi:predicted RND superfamily exporter protein